MAPRSTPGPRVALLTLALALLTLPLPGQGRVVRVGIFPAPPLVAMGQRRPEGLFLDILGAVAKEEGWRLTYVEAPWEDLLARLAAGDLDLLPAVGFTQARTGSFDFNRNPVYTDSGVLFTRPGKVPRSLHDLDGLRIAGVAGSAFTTGFEDYLRSFNLHCLIVPVKDNPEVMRRVASGEVDAGVCIYSLGMHLSSKYRVTVTPVSFSPLGLHFAVPKGRNADLLGAIDTSLAAMLAEPTSVYYRSYAAWILPARKSLLPTILAWAFLPALGLGALFAAWSLSLRREVRRKTRSLEDEVEVRRRAEAELRTALEEKSVLVRELYHRTKNNMQIITSLISLKAGYLSGNEGVQDLATSTTSRIGAIALVQQMLYAEGSITAVPMRPYLAELAASLLAAQGPRASGIHLDLQVAELRIHIDQAIPLGLLVNELLSNSLKFAFREGERGQVEISLARDATGGLVFRYADTGQGLPTHLDPRHPDSLGLLLVCEISEHQLRGRLTFSPGPGFGYRLDLPVVAEEGSP